MRRIDQCDEKRFLRDVSEHKMIVKMDNGTYRHLVFKKPESSEYRFELITWPGYLTYVGDMGDFTFSRLDDMFQFFRTDKQQPVSGQTLFINTDYWAEKCVSVDKADGIKEYSPSLFREVIQEWIDQIIHDHSDNPHIEQYSAWLKQEVNEELLCYADDGEAEVRRLVDNFEIELEGEKLTISDFWETTLTEKTFRFIWCCYAIAWGIAQYDKAKNA